MQNKGVIRFIAISLALVVIYYLFFTFKAASVRQDANEYAEEYVESLKTTPGGVGYPRLIYIYIYI